MLVTVQRAVADTVERREEGEDMSELLLRYATARDLSDEWAALPLSVIGEPLYVEIDRFRSEAEFRAALAGPLAALGGVVLARSDASWWVLVLGIAAIIAVLLALGLAWRQAQNEADTAIADGIFATKIKPLALDPEQIRRRARDVQVALRGAY
jgi:hypothetical protein